MKNNILFSICLLTFFIGAGYSSNSESSSAKQCGSAISATGYGHPKSKAKSNAESAWSNLASNIHAPSFSNWNKARKKEKSCVPSGSWPYRNFTCVYKAEPCSKH